MPFASEQERNVADKVLQILLSEKYKPKNYLFLEPFDLNEVPDYLQIVGKPLDLRYIADRFHKDLYDGADFWTDLTNVYQNAIKYHGNKQASKWIAKYAKDMLKVLGRERKNAENPTEKKVKAKLKVKLMSSLEQGGGSAAAGYSVSSIVDFAAVDSVAAASPASPHTPSPKPKPSKLKVQLPTAATAPPPPPSAPVPVPVPPPSLQFDPEAPAAVAAATKRPKLKLKLSSKSLAEPGPLPALGGGDAPSPATPPVPLAIPISGDAAAKVVPKKAKPTQPKLKLKLSLARKPSSGSLGPAKAAKKKREVDGDDDDDNDSEEEARGAKQSAPAPQGSSSTPSNNNKTNKTLAPAGPSRGKELPQGVAAPPPPPVAPKPKKTKKAAPPATKKAPAPTAAAASAPNNAATSGSAATAPQQQQQPRLDLQQTKQCCKVIAGLRRRKNKQISWFLMPVSDKNILPDYKSKIKSPMDLQTIQSKLDKGSYKKLDAFCLDVRRVFANALRYNTSIKDSLRPLAVEVLQTAESLMLMFIARHYPLSYAPLLYCWKVCIDIMDTLYNLVNPNDGQPMAYYFLHPVSVYCGGKFPADYLEKVKKPMDFGTITANLVEGRYQNVDAFAADCRLVVQNCQTYYQGKEESRLFLDQAMRLNECLSTQLAQLARYDKSAKGDSERRKAAQLTNQNRIVQEMILPNQPPSALFLSVLEDLRAVKYTDKGTKITEPAMTPFEKPVSLADFPDYLQYVQEPMDLQTVEKKVKLGTVYETPEDFEYDMNVMFKNCEVYNARRNAQHSVAMAKFAARKFRSIFYAKIQAYEDPASVVPSPRIQVPAAQAQPTDGGPQSSSPSSSSSPPQKKIKIDASGVSKGKTAPRISITASQVSSATASAGRAKSPAAAAALPKQPPKPKIDQPVPLHIAIAKVKEAFPLRRAVKSLQSWEADCARYFKELMRHPWISAARPKFVFSCPVPILFPELREHYAAKIRNPMDLTTIECTLLAGNRYAAPDDFIQDVALVFANAIRFNKDGKDVGDPLSCAYYDASVHLLKYSRWLSLELLSNHIDNSEHTNENGADGLPPFAWKLTTGNRKVARKEIENIVLKEPIEKSLEGDRYTWMEAECEKLLKALRHQSDLRYMTFFIQPNYPADYTAFIMKPMDWEKVNRTLKKRHYDTIGALIDDLRLIFSNAEKYNSRLKGTDTVSGRAYEAAKFMSDKLEIAINKLLLSVSDRLERERIDHANAEREIEAAEQAEEAEIRAGWKKEPDRGESSPTPARSELLQKTRIVRRLPQRQQATDFEIPFFDEEDDGHHERSHFEVVKFQKAMFEKQRDELLKMRKVSAMIGASVLTRLMQRDNLDEELKKAILPSATTKVSVSGEGNSSSAKEESGLDSNKPSSVFSELEREGRGPLQIKFVSSLNPKKKLAKRKRPLQGFD